ncbi:DNA replication protein [Starmerella bacillaris]|uniref:DNA replication complex GINS protein PSF3 n=1 Tax=Starmerella bacillaris TaxID=1247836 RepID=A0AAV5RNM0_STABA|nr:DNA replication protein [Starmerella bacillaris]
MYYSLDDIETDGLRVPAKFQVDAPGLGWLNEEAKTENVPAGAEAILPLWLATPLASASVNEGQDLAFLNISEPHALNSDVINILRSDPASLDLRNQNRLFTNLAIYWCELFASDDFVQTVYEMTRLRSAYIFDAALAQSGIGGIDRGFDDYEQRLYQATAKVIRDAKQFRNRR